MTKKEIVVAVVLVCSIIAVSVGGYLLWRHFQDEKELQQALHTSQSDDITPIADTPESPSSASSELLFSSTELGQLNSSTPINGGGETKPAEANTPESFAQYDKYKADASALYADIQKGTGTEIVAGSKVAIYYKGWLTDGTLFDQTRTNKDGTIQPFMFTMGAQEVIPGMEQAIFGMKTGGTRRLIIPPSAGYGEQGQKDIIPPNAVLIFDVQLVAVQ